MWDDSWGGGAPLLLSLLEFGIIVGDWVDSDPFKDLPKKLKTCMRSNH